MRFERLPGPSVKVTFVIEDVDIANVVFVVVGLAVVAEIIVVGSVMSEDKVNYL